MPREPSRATHDDETASFQPAVARGVPRLGVLIPMAGPVYLHDQVGVMWQRVQAGARPTVAERAELRLACHHGAAEAARAVDLAYTAAGGASVYSSSSLQRCLRDIHVATQHVMLSPRNLETYAKVRLGLETDLSTL